MTDGGRDVTEDGEDTIEVESPASAINAIHEENRHFFTVEVDDDVVMDERIGRVSDVRESDGMQGGEIDVAFAEFTATITSGFWTCRGCGRVAAEPRTDGMGGWTCSICRREARQERKERRREEWVAEVEEALETDPEDAEMLI
jgi:radical SAM superfamily enzyme with C-terminal helix-hairpin-helix motif